MPTGAGVDGSNLRTTVYYDDDLDTLACKRYGDLKALTIHWII